MLGSGAGGGGSGSGGCPPPSGSSKSDFLLAAKAAREQRHAEKNREDAAVRLQANTRGWMARQRVVREVSTEFDRQFPPDCSSEVGFELKSSIDCYRVARNFLSFSRVDEEEARFERLCRYILASLDSDSTRLSYISVALSKEHALAWISHMKTILWQCSERIDAIRLDSAVGGGAAQKQLSTHLRMLVSFTSPNTWAVLRSKSMAALATSMTQLCANFMGHLVSSGFMGHMKRLLMRGLCGSGACGSRTSLQKTTLAAVVTLTLRPVLSADFSDKLTSIYLLGRQSTNNVLSVPALTLQLKKSSPESLQLLQKNGIVNRSVKLLSHEQQLKIHFNALEGSYALCLTANLVHLVSIMSKEEFASVDLLSLLFVVTRLLESCGQYVTAKQSNLSHWHPVLGWFSVSLDGYLQDSMERVRTQLSMLWSPHCVKLFSHPLTEIVQRLPELPTAPDPEPLASQLEPSSSLTTAAGAKQLFKKALEKTKSASSSAATSSHPPPKGGYTKMGSPECMKVALICSMYQHALRTLSQLKLEILAGLCYQNILLLPLWRLLQSFGPNCGQKTFVDHLSANSKGTAPEFQILILFCDCLSYVVTILDDVEMYEIQTPFTLGQFGLIAGFLNSFLYKSISLGLLSDTKSPLFASLHALLMVLYGRDNRRPYTRANHWLIRDIKFSSFLSDLEKGKKSSLLLITKMPHIIHHDERVVLFRRKVTAEKSLLGLNDPDSVASARSTLITVHRARIVEDGYRQLSSLSPNALKGVIRVKFINVQGLDEAGIDQDGVFKEFLEETIKRVFHPDLNLFRMTSESRLYPSPDSNLTGDDHLQLFEFVGKMIGKAVHEGIIVDVPFAPFFVSQVLGKDQSTAFYSYIDELPSFDQELYKNLTYVKHYDGDVSNLSLSFSFDQDVMGKIVTHELVPGGRGVIVTNENRISYLHHVAHFRMHCQIREQTSAFTRGFRSIIPNDWLQLFSSPEVQRLISGDNAPLDLKDLRKHTHYYGGFHDSHRVVGWLWETLEKDFDDGERSSFLKFVTSCSKPPLLGFEHLEPPFSIRCVEVGDDEDDGDTVGSVLRGFLAIKRKDPVTRLPTASTCFNLLKLPNYQKKGTLKEKLRLAVSCNTGFELS